MPEYVIQPGDTLSALAVKNKINLPDMMAANPSIKDPNKIQAGQTLQIPYTAAPVTESTTAQPVTSSAISQNLRAQLMDALAIDEGFRANAYPDPLNPKTGPITVGYGTTQNAPGAMDYLRSQNLDPSRVFSLGPESQAITEEQGRAMMGLTLDHNEKALKQMYPNYESFPGSAQNALQNMSYQMGTTGVGNFKNMSEALRQPKVDWKTVYDEALDSRWAKEQTPDRAQRVSKAFLESGNPEKSSYYSPKAAVTAAKMAVYANPQDR